MKNFMSFFGKIVFPIAILTTSCDPDTTTTAVSAVNTAHYGEIKTFRSQNVPCGGTSPFDLDFATRTSSDLVHAGFKSHWNPGADPFPCRTIQTSTCWGVFNFDLTEFLASHSVDEIETAALIINHFDPIGGAAHVSVTEPWSEPPPFGEGEYGINPLPGDYNYANFTVKAVTESWDPMEVLTGTRPGPIASTPLTVQNPQRNVFHAPGTIPAFQVIDEIRQINADPRLGDRVLHGFVIEPLEVQRRYQSSNHAYGSFEVELIFTYRPR